jgi:hypothetical protein
MVYFPDPVREDIRNPFAKQRYRKIAQHKITSDCAGLTYYQVTTLHTVHTSFNYDISPMD